MGCPTPFIEPLGSLVSTRHHRREVLTPKQIHAGKAGLSHTVVRGQFHRYGNTRPECGVSLCQVSRATQSASFGRSPVGLASLQ